MTRRNLVLLLITLAMMGVASGMLLQLKAGRKLGPAAVKTSPIDGSIRVKVELPERVLNFTSEFYEPEELVLQTLPKDTSFGHRIYKAPDGFELSMNAVLMGTDRTSIHKPQICLSGFGWNLDDTPPVEKMLLIDGPIQWELPVARLLGTKEIMIGGRLVTARCVYVYWFAAEDRYTSRHWERMWWMARDLVRTGVLQRWSYMSCLAVCQPGHEERVYRRLLEFVAAAAPQLHVPPKDGVPAPTLQLPITKAAGL